MQIADQLEPIVLPTDTLTNAPTIRGPRTATSANLPFTDLTSTVASVAPAVALARPKPVMLLSIVG